jgi:hypothetical protein
MALPPAKYPNNYVELRVYQQVGSELRLYYRRGWDKSAPARLVKVGVCICKI